MPDHDSPNMGLQEGGVPQVAHAELQVQRAIPLADHGILGEHHSVLPGGGGEGRAGGHLLLGLASFAKTMPAMHAWMITPTMLWMHSSTRASSQRAEVPRYPYLGWQRQVILAAGIPPYGVLRLHTHEEGGGPALVHGKHTRLEVLRQLGQGDVLSIIVVRKVPVDIGNQVPRSSYLL